MYKVGNLCERDIKLLMEAIGKRESSNNYSAENRLGYLGKYQFGAAALVDAGFISMETYKHWRRSRLIGQKEFLSNPNNWDLYDGGKVEWFKDEEAQDEAVCTLLNPNYKRLKRKGVLKEDTWPPEVAGYLMAAHLGGWSNAARYAGGMEFNDANGTKISTYFNLGKRAIDEYHVKT